MIYYIVAAIGMAILGFAVWAKCRAGWKRIHQQVLGILTLVYGIFLALLPGSYTSLVLPGLGGITLGAGAGAAVGLGTWLVLGTIGVATGGVGLAIGAASMTAIGALFGGIGSTAGGFEIHVVSYPLVHWIFWVPLLVIGAYFIWGHKLKKLRGREHSGDEGTK
jgi:hypothetical protein